MTFDDLAHDIEARVREKLSEAGKNAFRATPAAADEDARTRMFTLGERRSDLAETDGRLTLRNGADGDAATHAIELPTIEPASESIYEYLAAGFPGA